MNKVSICDHFIIFESDEFPRWTLPIDTVKVIGEYTTQEGPFIEDHFLVFVDTENKLYEIPIVADGLTELLNKISLLIKYELKISLYFSTEFKSKVIYPEILRDEDLFTFVNTKTSKFNLNNILNLLLGIPTVSRMLNKNIQNFPTRIL